MPSKTIYMSPIFKSLVAISHNYFEACCSIVVCMNDGLIFAGSFGINCGRTQIIIQSSVTYDADAMPLGPSTYYVSGSGWAVSNVGRFIDNPTKPYTQNTGTRFADTQNSELFQGSRLSPSSLRYYGIGLENGNYDVQLSFGEIDSWVSNGPGIRLFDIYIQVRPVLRYLILAAYRPRDMHPI